MKKLLRYFKNFMVDPEEEWDKVLYLASQDAQGDVLLEREGLKFRRAVWRIGGLNFVRQARRASLSAAHRAFVECILED